MSACCKLGGIVLKMASCVVLGFAELITKTCFKFGVIVLKLEICVNLYRNGCIAIVACLVGWC